MSVHGDDVMVTIREVLKATGRAPTLSEVRIHPNPNQGWRNRDGRLTFDAISREGWRAFRVTVEVIDIDDFEGEVGSDEWVVQEPAGGNTAFQEEMRRRGQSTREEA